ncbi:(-)-germacrene D synthase-like [Dioscorea cayenensis subsp. rotundata]|uniref:(-)-germacrene D synthase-like n=1 Tax=Dioscorea cayennensis subsp. rotundata TaxID=55577 RepID=A0AB40AW89_DIOCR|nr:(-)-germacrene D synthase-like [Dioscorea cayenensis subsp. rotundata]
MEPVNNGPPPNVIHTPTMERCFKVAKNEDVVVRPIANFHPSLWGDYFITNVTLSSTHQEEQMKQRMQVLVKDVKILLKDAKGSMREEMQLIDALQRLGVAYHFEQEISEALWFINTSSSSGHHSYSDDDLHFVALRFRLLRERHYYVPPYVFNQFMDGKGKFKEEVSNDLNGFVKACMKQLTLESLERICWMKPFDFYRSHLQSLVNDVVLELAKLDFHILQLLHREEVKKISMWWKDVGVPTKLTFARDRIVELYFWILGVYFEPQYSRARMMMVKVISMVSLMDDVYDSYGTMVELQHFTGAIQRWDFKAADEMENVPSLAEHLELSIKTSTLNVVACASFIGMGENSRKHSFDWVTSFPQIIKDVSKLSRLMDDVGVLRVCMISI